MSNSFDDKTNPYAPTSSLGMPGSGTINESDAKLIKDFRSQILALGVLWIIFAILCVGLLFVVLSGSLGNQANLNDANQYVFAGLLGLVGVGWLVSGVMALMKSQAGVYIGLVLSYLSLIGNFINMNICGIVILILIVIQAHRVISFASKLRSRGYSLHQRV